MLYVVFCAIFWFLILLLLYIFIPNNYFKKHKLEDFNKKDKIIVSLVLFILITITSFSMKLSPIWNGEEGQYRNQYELMADAILEGHLDIRYEDIDEKLLEMKNPYDPKLREELNVNYHWDHAFYKGKYYMYFGVVPTFVLFIPYKLITGNTLITYHATQIFVGLFIIGIFLLFFKLSKLFFKNISFGLYLLLSTAFSIISILLCLETPSLYCTAISSGLCFMTFSIYFFIKAVFDNKSENKSLFYAFIGSLFGALTFGCRPPIALVNIIAIPLLIIFLKNRKLNLKLILKLLGVISPYIIIGVLLMLYNYIRFDSPFEFGQAYQLTVADQSNYTDVFKNIDFKILSKSLITNFLGRDINSNFKFLRTGGIFVNYILLLFPILLLFDKNLRNKIKEKNLSLLIVFLFLVPIIITVFDTLYSPYLLERYHLDIYFIICINDFLILGLYYNNLDKKNKRIFELLISILCVLTLIKCYFIFIKPYDGNFTWYYPGSLDKILKSLIFKFK